MEPSAPEQSRTPQPAPESASRSARSTTSARGLTEEPVAGAMPQTDGERWVICNPNSGTADHADRVRELATDRGYRYEATTDEGHASRLAAEAAADGATLVAVAGGDGTIHEVVEGLVAADALDRTGLAVLPTGTENIFASSIGVQGVEQGFDVVETGARRRIDVGMADDEPFVLSCIAGLVADASVATSAELKARFGSFAFLITGIQEMASFDGLHIDLTASSADGETTWSGDALGALVGNVRRFVKEGGQADVEDGLLDVVIVEEMPAGTAVAEAVAQRVLGQDTDHVFHVQANELEIASLDDTPIDFSLDGERSAHDRLSIRTRPHALRVCVGPDYRYRH